MERRLTAGEALEHVLGNPDDAYSSADESEIDEDPHFPLPVAYSDDESPGSPAHAGVVNYTYAPSLQTTSTCTAAACASTSMAVPTLLAAAPPTPPAGTNPTQAQRGAGVE